MPEITQAQLDRFEKIARDFEFVVRSGGIPNSMKNQANQRKNENEKIYVSKLTLPEEQYPRLVTAWYLTKNYNRLTADGGMEDDIRIKVYLAPHESEKPDKSKEQVEAFLKSASNPQSKKKWQKMLEFYEKDMSYEMDYKEFMLSERKKEQVEVTEVSEKNGETYKSFKWIDPLTGEYSTKKLNQRFIN